MRFAVSINECLINSRNFSFRNQAQRSAILIPTKIVEGFKRKSNKEFIQFLDITKDSCAELRTLLYLATKVSLFENRVGEGLLETTRKISTILFKLIQIRKQRF